MPFLAETERKFGIKYDMRQTEELMPMSKKGSQIAELEKAMLSVYMKQKPLQRKKPALYIQCSKNIESI